MKWANYLQTQNLARLNHEKIENLNSLWLKETESVVKNLPTEQSSRSDDFTGEFYQTLQEVFQNNWGGGTTS